MKTIQLTVLYVYIILNYYLNDFKDLSKYFYDCYYISFFINIINQTDNTLRTQYTTLNPDESSTKLSSLARPSIMLYMKWCAYIRYGHVSMLAHATVPRLSSVSIRWSSWSITSSETASEWTPTKHTTDKRNTPICMFISYWIYKCVNILRVTYKAPLK